MIITVENYLIAGAKIVQIKNSVWFWVKMKDVEKELGLSNLPDLVRKEILGILGVKKRCDKDFKEYKRSLQEITRNMKDSVKEKYIRNDNAEKIIKNCRGVKKCKDGSNKDAKEKQRQNFRVLLGFNERDIFLTKAQSVVDKILETFSREEIFRQYSVLNYKIDLYFVKYNLAVEIDENGHVDRDDD